MIEKPFLDVIRAQFQLDWHGIHGAPHWARVRLNGLRLAEHTGARTDVVELFAFLHDTRRLNDDYDPEHGPRAAAFARELHREYFQLDDTGLDLLTAACAGHSDGLIEAEITVQTCWDADRLDLGRVGKKPDPRRLCTTVAKNPRLISDALQRSLRG